MHGLLRYDPEPIGLTFTKRMTLINSHEKAKEHAMWQQVWAMGKLFDIHTICMNR